MTSSRSFIPPLMGREYLTFDNSLSVLDEIIGNMSDLLPSIGLRPYVPLLSALPSFQPKSNLPDLKTEKDTFKVMLNVSRFKPDEVEVKLVGNYVVIHGKHEEKLDEHGSIQREFTRRYLLPEGTDSEALKSTWNYHGILIVEAPKKATEPASDTRVIPITVVSNKTKNEGIAVVSNKTKNEGIAVVSNKTKNEGIAVVSNKTENEGIAVVSNKTENEGIAVVSNKPENEGIAVVSNKPENEGIAVVSNKPENEGIAVVSNKPENEGIAVVSNKPENEGIAVVSNKPENEGIAVVSNKPENEGMTNNETTSAQ